MPAAERRRTRSGFAVLGIFKETASGTRNNRLARNRVLQLAQARRIDAVLVTELSRWGRSTQDLLDTLYRLTGWKVSLVAMNGMTFELNTPRFDNVKRPHPDRVKGLPNKRGSDRGKSTHP